MPSFPPPPSTAPYDYLESVLNVARTRLNDAIQNLDGEILTDFQPFTGTMTNSAWRKLQAYIANLGFSKYKRKFFGIALPVTATYDPSQPNIWTWSYYFDGTSYWYESAGTSVLPQDLICPLYLKERQTGTGAPFSLMRYRPDGLDEYPKTPRNGQWEWKNDAIYLPGATYSQDFEVEYAAYDADFPVDGNNVLVTPATQQVPLMRCQSALANFLCAEMAGARADMDAKPWEDAAKEDVKLMQNNDVKLKQRTPVQRRSYSRRGRGSYSAVGFY